MSQFIQGTFKVKSEGSAAQWSELFAAKTLKQRFEAITSEESGRSDSGKMHLNVKKNIRSWEIELPMCTAQKVYDILSIVQGKKYYINIYDTLTHQELTELHVFTLNSATDCYNGVLNTDGLYQGVSFIATEIGEDEDEE